jgi:ribosomal protein L23
MEVNVKKQLILKPVLSEKSLLGYKNNKICTFLVDSKSTKTELMREFEVLFGVKPVSITTVVSRRNKKARTATKVTTNRKYIKKAYVNIGENSLDIFENIS